MATYPVVHLKTGETKEVKMSIHEWDQWRKDNPEWSRDYLYLNICLFFWDVNDWKYKLIARRPGLNNMLDRASKMPGSKVKKI